jgi:hypothetical protein
MSWHSSIGLVLRRRLQTSFANLRRPLSLLLLIALLRMVPTVNNIGLAGGPCKGHRPLYEPHHLEPPSLALPWMFVVTADKWLQTLSAQAVKSPSIPAHHLYIRLLMKSTVLHLSTSVELETSTLISSLSIDSTRLVAIIFRSNISIWSCIKPKCMLLWSHSVSRMLPIPSYSA